MWCCVCLFLYTAASATHNSYLRTKSLLKSGRSQSRIKLFQFVPYVTHIPPWLYGGGRPQKRNEILNLCILAPRRVYGRLLDVTTYIIQRIHIFTVYMCVFVWCGSLVFTSHILVVWLKMNYLRWVVVERAGHALRNSLLSYSLPPPGVSTKSFFAYNSQWCGAGGRWEIAFIVYNVLYMS